MGESAIGMLAVNGGHRAPKMTPWSCITAGWRLKTAARSGNSATSSRLTTTVMRNDTEDASRKALLPLLISGNVLTYGHRLITTFHRLRHCLCSRGSETSRKGLEGGGNNSSGVTLMLLSVRACQTMGLTRPCV